MEKPRKHISETQGFNPSLNHTRVILFLANFHNIFCFNYRGLDYFLRKDLTNLEWKIYAFISILVKISIQIRKYDSLNQKP